MNDPYHDIKIYHKAGKTNANGDVSALCFPIPHAINLKRELWTLRDESVTCKKCRAAFNTELGKKVIEGLKKKAVPSAEV